jgi:transcriptional regulator with XRE-family HTH domain
MGYRGKTEEQEEARRLRADSWTLQEIADKLGVSKSSVSLWVRDVPFTPSPRRYGAQRRPHPQHLARLAQIDELDREGRELVGVLSEQAFLAAGIALYAGGGAKTDRNVRFANTDATMVRFYLAWLRRFFAPHEARLRVRVYLHEGLDIDATHAYWSEVTGIPLTQFGKPYRAKADPSIRRNKHEHGCVYVNLACATTHRRIMGLVRALLSSEAIPG